MERDVREENTDDTDETDLMSLIIKRLLSGSLEVSRSILSVVIICKNSCYLCSFEVTKNNEKCFLEGTLCAIVGF